MAIAMDTFHAEDSTTNTVVTISEFIKKSSGTPASGIGAAIALGAENSAGTATQAIQIQGYLSTVTNTSEQGVFLLRVKNAGSFMDALQITVASNTVTVGSNQTTVNLWSTVATTVNAWGVATAITVGDSTTCSTTLRGGTVLGNTTTQNVFTTVATTVNAFQAATTLNIGNSSGATNLAGTLDVSSRGAIGNNSSVSSSIGLGVNELYSNTSGTLRGVLGSCGLNPSGTSTADCYGVQASVVAATAQTFSGLIAGVRGITNLTAAGTIARGHGVIAELVKSAGTITDYRGFYSYDTGSSTTVTTAYGIYLDELGAATTEYGLYVADLNDAGTNYAIYTNAGLVRFGDSVSMLGAANVMGDASTDLFTFTGRCILRAVTDAGPMTATGGTAGEIVRNTSDNKFYGCTVSHASAATWVALN